MIVINTSGKVIAKSQIKKAPIVRVISKKKQTTSGSEQNQNESNLSTTDREQTEDQVYKSLAAELREVMVERDKLSAEIYPLVQAYENRKIPITKLESLYDDIEKLTQEGSSIYEKIAYYDRYHELPKEEDSPNPLATTNINDLKVLKRSIENRRSKLKINIQKFNANPTQVKNPHKILEWESKKIDLEEQYEEVCNRIKELENG